MEFVQKGFDIGAAFDALWRAHSCAAYTEMSYSYAPDFMSMWQAGYNNQYGIQNNGQDGAGAGAPQGGGGGYSGNF